MTPLDRFFSEGLRNAERRLPLIAPVTPREEEAVVAMVRSSVVVRLCDRVIDLGQSAWRTSAVAGPLRAMWNEIAPSERCLLIGLALMVASTLHIGLVLWHERPIGWLWVIVPALALVWGVLLTVFSTFAHTEHG